MEVRFFNSFDDDFSFSKEQDYKIDENYDFLKNGFFHRLFSAILYPPFLLFGFFYTRLHLKLRIKGKENLKKVSGPYVFFSNHTQPVADAFVIPTLVFPRRVNVMVSPANLKVKFFGKIISYLGAIPLSSTIKGLIKFNRAFLKRGKKRVSVIFPEAHVWEYCEDIRPFKKGAFLYPEKLGQPAFSLTLTYQKSHFGKRPRTTAYIDGPFTFSPDKTKSENARILHDTIYNTMSQRAKNSNAHYIEYRRREEIFEKS